MIAGADKSPGMAESFAIVEMDGQEVIKVTSPENITNEFSEKTSLSLSHAYIVHQDSCLWFAVGGENAIEIIRSSVARCAASGLAARTPLVTASIDMDRWLSYPQDDSTGIAGLLLWLDLNHHEFPPSPISVSVSTGSNSAEKPTPLLQRVADLGGEMQAGVTVIADRNGLRLNLKMGEVLANYYVARMIDMQETRMKMQRARAEERAEKAGEKAEFKAGG